MRIFNSIQEFNEARDGLGKLSFVPTMGNLHEGHLSLVKFAKENYSEVIASIFVNPLQFGKNEDFSCYPKTLDKDIELLEDLECNYLFLPEQNFAENLELNSFVAFS